MQKKLISFARHNSLTSQVIIKLCCKRNRPKNCLDTGIRHRVLRIGVLPKLQLSTGVWTCFMKILCKFQKYYADKKKGQVGVKPWCFLHSQPGCVSVFQWKCVLLKMHSNPWNPQSCRIFQFSLFIFSSPVHLYIDSRQLSACI